jgi:hypothetical protein
MGSMGAIGRRFRGHQAPVIRENRARNFINSVLGIARASRALTLLLVPRDWVRCETATPPMSQLVTGGCEDGLSATDGLPSSCGRPLRRSELAKSAKPLFDIFN